MTIGEPSPLQSIEELRPDTRGIIRLPPGIDVPLTPRVKRLIDSVPMRRLSHVSQLGLVQLVYPGACHSRFEHSLGVYGTAVEFLRRLSSDRRFAEAVSHAQATTFLAAALMHDVGHWPFCHPIEDLRLPNVERHESLARKTLTEGPVAELLQRDWQLEGTQVADAIERQSQSPGERIVASMLSGPIDVDKIDYLARDSLHAGVPYGRHFDAPRLMASLCLNAAGDAIAITDKGRTAAELMVFARYVMFSEVYWHHTVRAATAMLQRGVFLLADRIDWPQLYSSTDSTLPPYLLELAAGTPAAELLSGLFGPERRLYKRLAEFSLAESPEAYQCLARRPYPWLHDFAHKLALYLERETGERCAHHEILVDAPPVQTEVQCNIDVYFPRSGQCRPLRDVSPVVDALAQRQFDDFVKRVRVYAHPRVAKRLVGVAIDKAITTIAECE
jgi:HD superfamily phosphohydrolase